MGGFLQQNTDVIVAIIFAGWVKRMEINCRKYKTYHFTTLKFLRDGISNEV